MEVTTEKIGNDYLNRLCKCISDEWNIKTNNNIVLKLINEKEILLNYDLKGDALALFIYLNVMKRGGAYIG